MNDVGTILEAADIAAILKALPHRYPFLMVDRVIKIRGDQSGIGIKNVTANEPCFAHLGETTGPNSYAYPCSLILESFAQTAGILMNGRWKQMGERQDSVLLFASLSGARFTGEEVFPGDTLEHRTCLERQLSHVAILRGEVWVRERQIAEIDRIIVKYRNLQATSPGALPRGEAPPQVDQGGNEL